MLSSFTHPRLLKVSSDTIGREGSFHTFDHFSLVKYESYSLVLQNGLKIQLPLDQKIYKYDQNNLVPSLGNQLSLEELIPIPAFQLKIEKKGFDNVWKEHCRIRSYEERRSLGIRYEKDLSLLNKFSLKYLDHYDEFIYLNKNQNFSRSSYFFLLQLQILHSCLYPTESLMIREKTNGYYFFVSKMTPVTFGNDKYHYFPIIKLEKNKYKKSFHLINQTFLLSSSGLMSI